MATWTRTMTRTPRTLRAELELELELEMELEGLEAAQRQSAAQTIDRRPRSPSRSSS